MDAERFLGEIGKACRRIRDLSRADVGRDADWTRELLAQLAECARELNGAAQQFRSLNGELAVTSAELEHERRQAHRLFVSAPCAYLMSDLSGAISMGNQVAGQMLGIPAAQLAGKPLSTFVELGDRERFDDWVRVLREAAVEASLCADCGGRYEFQMRSYSRARSFPCQVIAAPEGDRDGVIRRIRWMLTDLTDRTGAATAQKLREENRRRDEFLAVLGHELRNPLAAITLAADILGGECNDAPGRVDVTCGVLKRNAAQLRRLVDDLMDVSLVTRGKVALQLAVIDLRDVVAAAAEAMQPILVARQHQLAFVRPRQKLLVRGDASRLTQVLSNLLDNAAKYTPVGGHLEVALMREGERAIVAISDDGIGIPPHMLERVFHPFEQGTESGEPTGRGRGLGLGLALVHQLVELHHGTVRAFSAGEGKGSKFVVQLPLVGTQSIEVAPATEDPSSERAAVSRLLVIDDNQDAADLLAMSLRGRGYEVLVAHDGGGGLAQARESECDVALVDLGLPDMDGYQVCRELRRAKPAMRLFALTGYGDDHARSEATRAGFDGFLLKPVHADLIDQTIHQVSRAEERRT